jgi:AcrR family transcriptional regulator
VSKRRSPAGEAVTDETRERILAGAARTFGRLGYAAARVEDILAEAEISRPTFYKAFQSKADVFEELSATHHRDIRERILRALDGAPEPESSHEPVPQDI